MPRTTQARDKRNKEILEYVGNNPLATDEILAEYFKVSINTIRLDRSRLGIKEFKERLKDMAHQNTKKVISLNQSEIVGDIIEFIPGQMAISRLEIKDYMSFENTNIIKGTYIYSMAEMLAISLVPNKVALVGVANIKYSKKILRSETVFAHATVKKKRTTNYIVWVEIRDNKEELRFKGKFLLKGII